MDLKNFIIRITICFILSVLIGIERQYKHKTVGLRTNVLVSLGSFMFVSVSFNSLDTDYTRIAAQVVSSIGFIGAGVILDEERSIKNLIIKLTNKYNLTMKGFQKTNLNNNQVNLKINIISNDKFYFDETAKYITTSSNIDSIYIEHNKLIQPDNEDIEE